MQEKHLSEGKEVSNESAKIYCEVEKEPFDEISSATLLNSLCQRKVEWNSQANSRSHKSGACVMALNYSVRNKDLKPICGINN
jgi:hypothetical protein